MYNRIGGFRLFFFWSARLQAKRAEFSIIPHSAYFVKRKLIRQNAQKYPGIVVQNILYKISSIYGIIDLIKKERGYQRV